VAQISFIDTGLVKDLANNTLLERVVEAPLSEFVYVSEGEQMAVEGGGSGLKYTFLSVFSFNIIIKILM